jgi:hypothetical protein
VDPPIYIDPAFNGNISDHTIGLSAGSGGGGAAERTRRLISHHLAA